MIGRNRNIISIILTNEKITVQQKCILLLFQVLVFVLSLSTYPWALELHYGFCVFLHNCVLYKKCKNVSQYCQCAQSYTCKLRKTLKYSCLFLWKIITPQLIPWDMWPSEWTWQMTVVNISIRIQIFTNRFCVVIVTWLNASQRVCRGIWLNRSAREWIVKTSNQS